MWRPERATPEVASLAVMEICRAQPAGSRCADCCLYSLRIPGESCMTSCLATPWARDKAVRRGRQLRQARGNGG